MISRLFNETPALALERAMDASAVRAHLIADNIANADTPNYKAVRLKFEEFLERELGKTSQGRRLPLKETRAEHLPGNSLNGVKGLKTPVGIIYRDENTTFRLDGNNVDIDRESAEQAMNALQYSTLIELASRRFVTLRTAIHGGK
ncbi:MAG: flagellar basal body rod protein FlgB [bacterium]